MKIRVSLFAALAAMAGQPALAQTGANDATSVKVSPGEARYTSTTHAQATVTSINYTTRVVGLRLDDGTNVSMTAGPEIQRLDAVKAGDKVLADYEELMTVKLVKGGKKAIGWQSSSTDHRDAASVNPSASTTATDVLVANITKIDQPTSTVTLQGATQSKDVKVNDPKQLALMKVGDQVEVTVTRTLALSVQPVQ